MQESFCFSVDTGWGFIGVALFLSLMLMLANLGENRNMGLFLIGLMVSCTAPIIHDKIVNREKLSRLKAGITAHVGKDCQIEEIRDGEFHYSETVLVRIENRVIEIPVKYVKNGSRIAFTVYNLPTS